MNRNKFIVNFMVGFVKVTGIIPALLFLKPRVRRVNGARLPKNCMIVSNHKSLMDFVLYLAVFPFRTVRFLMAEVLFNKNKMFSKFLYAIGGIRVDRDAKDFSFISDALEVLDDGGTVGIFPEGRLPVGGKPFPFTVSCAFIAVNSDVPIVPVYTDGSYGIFKRANVVVGEKIYVSELKKEGLSDDEQLEHITGRLRDIVYSLESEIKKK